MSHVWCFGHQAAFSSFYTFVFIDVQIENVHISHNLLGKCDFKNSRKCFLFLNEPAED